MKENKCNCNQELLVGNILFNRLFKRPDINKAYAMVDKTDSWYDTISTVHKSLEEIHKIREEKKKELELRVNTAADTREKHILICHGTGCTSSKSPEIMKNFEKIIKKVLKNTN